MHFYQILSIPHKPLSRDTAQLFLSFMITHYLKLSSMCSRTSSLATPLHLVFHHISWGLVCYRALWPKVWPNFIALYGSLRISIAKLVGCNPQ
jgi:hypothetical protein